MRADRLLSLLMLLQSRGRMTASDLAAELEVSERTIYRDIDALSLAGVPVYGERGREGGYALVEGYRTRLTGLTAGEVRALFMFGVPGPLEELGASADYKAALHKLAASLPDEQRQDERLARQRVHLDARWWFQGEEPVPHLAAVQDAIWRDSRLRIAYQHPVGIEMEQVVEPYGLVAKAGVWYLAYAFAGRYRAIRVTSLARVQVCEEAFRRDPAFDLATFWRGWCERRQRHQRAYRAVVKVSPDVLPHLPGLLGHHLDQAVGDEGYAAGEWQKLELCFEGEWEARAKLLSLGGAAQVLEPEALRLSILDHAEQILQRYCPEAA